MLSSLRERWQRWRVRRRRHKLVMAYAKVGRHRYGLGPGFSPTLFAYDTLAREGLADVTEDGLDWHWPEDTPETVDV